MPKGKNAPTAEDVREASAIKDGFLVAKNFNATYGTFFDPFTRELFAQPLIHCVNKNLTSWKIDDKTFVVALMMMLAWFVAYWILSKIHWTIPAVVATTILYFHRMAMIQVLVLLVWYGLRLVYRLFFAPKPVDTLTPCGMPSYYMKPITTSERTSFKEMQSTLELIILVGAAGILIYGGQKSMYPLIVALVFMALARTVPSAGGHSTMSVIAMGMLLLFSFSLMGPTIITMWKEALDIDTIFQPTTARVEPELARPFGAGQQSQPVVALTLNEQVMNLIKTACSRLYEGLGLTINLNSMCGFIRCTLGFLFPFYALADALRGPGRTLAAMVFMTRTRDEKMMNIPIARAATLNALACLVNIILSAYSASTMVMVACILGIVTAWSLWYLFGDEPWVARGFWAKNITGRTDTSVPRFESPGGYRISLALYILAAQVIFYGFEFGFTGGMTFLLGMSYFAVKHERILTFMVGLLSANLPMVLMPIFSKEPLTGDLRTATSDAADPTYTANSGNNSKPANILEDPG